MRCPYCFENATIRDARVIRPPARTMSANIISSMSYFVRQQMEMHSKTNLEINLFGGEPLLFPDTCIDILSTFSDLPTQTIAVTNGSKLSPETIMALYELGLEAIQVTFDGWKDDHNQTRRLVSGQPSYNLVLSNLLRLAETLDKLRILVRVNVSHQNLASIGRIVDDLRPIQNIDRVTIAFEPIHDTETFRGDKYSSDQLVEQVINAYRVAGMAGFNLPRPSLQTVCAVCSVPSTADGCCVQPDGTLTSCWESVGHQEHVVGDLQNGLFPKEQLKHRWVRCGYNSTATHDDVMSFRDPVHGWLLDWNHFVTNNWDTSTL
nr:radical SAM protein [Trueperella pecoris]